MQKISVILPCYNEYENIAPLYKEIISVIASDFKGRAYEIIMVDDGSKDWTWNEIFLCKSKDQNVIWIRLNRNYGQSIALDAWFKKSSGDIIVTLDADMQNDPKDIKKLYDKLINEKLDLVTWWRKKRKDPCVIRIITKVAKFLRHFLINDKVKDSWCTLRVYIPEVVKNLYLWWEMHRYIIIIAKINGYKIWELEVHHRARNAGISKYDWKKSIRGLIDLIYIWFLWKFQSRPLHLFGSAGILSFFIGWFLLLVAIYEKIFEWVNINRSGYFFLWVFFSTMGIFVFIMGIMLDIMLRTYYNTSGVPRYIVKEEI